METRRKQLSFLVERFKGFWNQYKKSKRGMLGIVIIACFGFVAAFGPMLTDIDPMYPQMKGHYPAGLPKLAEKLCVPIWYKSVLGMTDLSENMLVMQDHEFTSRETLDQCRTSGDANFEARYSTTGGTHDDDGCVEIRYNREGTTPGPPNVEASVTLSKEFHFPYVENPKSFWWHYSLRVENRTRMKGRYTARLILSGIRDVSPSHLEAWAIFGDENVSIGKFTVDSQGLIRNLEGQVQHTFPIGRDLDKADTFIITIEPEGDTDLVPSGLVLLSGSSNGTRAELSFPADFSSVNGTFTLATPTDGSGTNETSGVWFLQLPNSTGLSLPTLPEGWIYEGWVENSGVPISMGRFSSPGQGDNFNNYSGPSPGLWVPGEDFLFNAPNNVTFPLNLTDGTSRVIVSVELDTGGVDAVGVSPSQIQPLVADILLNATDAYNYNMSRNLESVPSGSVVIREDVYVPVAVTVGIRRGSEPEAHYLRTATGTFRLQLPLQGILSEWRSVADATTGHTDLETSIFTGAGNYTLEFIVTIADQMEGDMDVTIYVDNLQLVLYGKTFGLLGTSQIPATTPRDLFTMLVYGTRISFMIGLLTAIFSVLIGLFVGLVSGYVRGFVDEGLMRFADFLLVLPGLPLLIVLVTVLGRSIWNIIGVLIFMGWMGFARSVRSMVLSLRERPFIESARASGAGTGYVIYRHILPNVFALVYISMATSVPGAIIAEASLAWLGLGDVNIPSWGMMLYDFSLTGLALAESIGTYWFWVIPPGVAIALMAMAFILMGFSLDEILNPRLRKRR